MSAHEKALSKVNTFRKKMKSSHPKEFAVVRSQEKKLKKEMKL